MTSVANRTSASSPAGDAARRVPVAGLVIAIAVGIASVALGWFRLPAIARDTLWAEDSRLFLQDRIVYGPWATVFRPYDGYQHLGPRLLTDVAVLVAPIEQYAHVVTLLALAAVGVIASATYAFSGGLLRTRVARIALSLVPVVLPTVATEALGNFATLHSFALFLAPFVLLYRSPSRTRTVFQALVVFAVAMTEIQTACFLPLLVLMARCRRVWPVGVAYVVGLAVQFGSSVLQPRVRHDLPPVVPLDTVRGFFAEASLSVWAPDSAHAASLLEAHGRALLVGAFLPFLVAFAVTLVAPWGRRSVLAIVLACGAAVIWFGDVVISPTVLISFGAGGWGSLAAAGFVRYALVPSMFLVALLVVAADRLLAPRPARGAEGARGRLRVTGVVGTSVGVLALVVVAAAAVSGYHPAFVWRQAGPDWQQSVQVAEQSCEAKPAAARQRIEGAPGGWAVIVACEDVDGAARFP